MHVCYYTTEKDMINKKTQMELKDHPGMLFMDDPYCINLK